MPGAETIVRVDLGTETVATERVPESWSQAYVGGKGLGVRYLYEELEAGVDPLGPENVVLVLVGPLTGYLPGEQRYVVVTKSPLTGTFLDSYAGGSMAGRLAGSLDGHVGILISGRAQRPIALSVANGEVTLDGANEWWGLDVEAVDDRVGDGAVACIGPAGEHQVAYATIASDGGDHHAGRGGAGAVFGAKRLKAIVASDEPPAVDGDLERLQARHERAFADHDTGRWHAASATAETIDFADEVGVLPTRGWQAGSFEGAGDVGIEAVRAASVSRERPTDSVPGGFRIETDDGEHVPRGGTSISLGAGLGIDDVDAVMALGSVCDRLALDLISGGNAVAWAIRAAEEGILERELSFGDERAARQLIEEIATRSTPLGDALADGVEAAASTYGGSDLIPSVKGMELPTYDPRGASAMALAYATSDRGACHRRARPVEVQALEGDTWTIADRVEAVITEQDRRALRWSLIADDFLGDVLSPTLGAKWLEAVGRESDPASLWDAGERIWTLVRLFNVREGFSRADDELPPRLTEPLEDGPNEGAAIDPDEFEATLEAYYDRRGWDQQGRPTAETLDRLGIDLSR